MQTTLVILILTVPFFVLTIWAIVDAAQKNFGSLGKKVMWAVIASVPFIGAIIYFIFGFRKGKKPGADEALVD